MDESLKADLFLTLTRGPNLHHLVAEAIAAYLDALPSGSAVGFYGCGSIAEHLVAGHTGSLRRLRTTFVVTQLGGESSFNGFPLVSVDALQHLQPDCVVLLSSVFQREMVANLARLHCASILTLPAIFESYGLEELLERILAPEKAPAGDGDGQPVAPSSPASGRHLLTRQVVHNHRLWAVFQEIVLKCVEANVQGWWDQVGLLTLWHFTSWHVVRRALRQFVLRQAGDYKTFLRLSGDLDCLGVPRSGADSFLIDIAMRYSEEMSLLGSSQSPPSGGKKPFLLAFPIWGEAYLDKFLTYCLPSLLERGNLPALSRRRAPFILIHTDEEGEARLSKSARFQHLWEIGVTVRFLRLDRELMKSINAEDDFKYWHLGMIQSVQLAWAKTMGGDYHITLPDTIYAAGYFERLLNCVEQGHPTIFQTAFRTDIDRVGKAVEPFRHQEAIRVEAGELMSIALNNLHPDSQFLRMNDRPALDQWPAFHALLWEEAACLHVICPHQSISYMDASVIAQIPDRFFFTLDSEIDKVLPEGEIPYYPQVEDGLVLLELSPSEVTAAPGIFVDIDEYARIFWSRIEAPRHLEYYCGDMIFPVEPSSRGPRVVLSKDRVCQEMGDIQQKVRDTFPVTGLYALMNGLVSLVRSETHAGAEGHLPEIRSAAKRIWESGRASVTPGSSTDLVQVIARWLVHFDLLEEAGECMARNCNEGKLSLILKEFRGTFVSHARWGRAMGRQAEGRPIYLLGTTLWGEPYINFFLEFHVPSLLAPGNLPGLARTGRIVMSVVTDQDGRELIMRAPVFQVLSQLAEVRFTVVRHLPDRLTEENKRDFYRHYGLLDHHHVVMARESAAHLILLPPDTVVSGSGLQSLGKEIAQGYDCCSIACIEVNLLSVLPDLEVLRDGFVLDAGVKALGAIAVRHKSAYFKSLFMDAETRLNAYPREFFWRIPGGYRCHSLFMHPIMLSKRVMSRPFHPNYENVDWALIPRVLQADGRMRVMEDASTLFILHCSHPDVRADELSIFHGRASSSLITYLLGINQHAFPVHRSLLCRAQFLPLEDPDLPISTTYIEDARILQAAFYPGLVAHA